MKHVLSLAALLVAGLGLALGADEPKAIWKVPGSGHVGGITARPKEYEHRVIEFFDRTLLRTA